MTTVGPPFICLAEPLPCMDPIQYSYFVGEYGFKLQFSRLNLSLLSTKHVLGVMPERVVGKTLFQPLH